MDEEISDGVKILCDRMESNPEEFLEQPYEPNTFDRKLGKFYYDGKNIEAMAKGEADHKYWYLTAVERQALITAYLRMIRTEHTREVIERLLDKEPEEAQQALPKGLKPISKQSMINSMTPALDSMFTKEYERYREEQYQKAEADLLKYKASGRYTMSHDIPDPWKTQR